MTTRKSAGSRPRPAEAPAADPTAGVWASDGPVLVCAQADGRAEQQILDEWIAANAPAGTATVRVPYAGDEDVNPIADVLVSALDGASDDTVLLPIRVVWQDEPTTELPRLWEALMTGDPRHPRRQVQSFLRRVRPEGTRVVVAEPASVRALRTAWQDRSDTDADAFPRFVARRLVLASERAEARLLGPQHKVPRLVREEIATSGRFRAGLRRLATQLDRPAAEVALEADEHLENLVAGYSRAETDVNLLISRRMYQVGYEVDVVPEQVTRTRELMRSYPTVTLSSHRSYLDGAILPVLSHEYGLPRRHVLAGANLDFWPIGTIARRSGAIFVKRDSRDAPVYRFALREYLGYLVEKRFHLEWYIEGGRSRTGKMLPPKLGALSYVVDAFRDGRADDVYLLPVAITYDQLREVGDFAGEAAGGAKQAESAGWLLRFLSRRGERYGKVYVRFAEPISLREALGSGTGSTEAAESDLDLQKLGFEVAWRILQATPATGSALLALTLLTGVDRALTLPQLRSALRVVLEFAERHHLPLTTSAQALSTEAGVQAALDSLIKFGVVTRFDEGPEAVYRIEAGQHVVAAFYRNTIIHFFLNNALLELALVRASRSAEEDATAAFWDAAMALRDLLKFDFFFPEKDSFRAALAAVLTEADPEWAALLASGSAGAEKVLHGFRFPVAHATLRPFLEAYLVVATALAEHTEPGWDARAIGKQCLALGRQMLLQQRIARPESVSAQLFRPALQLAEHRGLLAEGEAARAGRAAFLDEVAAALDGIEEIDAIARRSYVRMLAPSAGRTQ